MLTFPTAEADGSAGISSSSEVLEKAECLACLMMELDEKLKDHKSFYNSAWAKHECLNQISW